MTDNRTLRFRPFYFSLSTSYFSSRIHIVADLVGGGVAAFAFKIVNPGDK